MGLVIKPVKRLYGEVVVPGDKSISHRAIILSSLATGTSYIRNLLEAEDLQRTITSFREMGIAIIGEDEGYYKVEGKGLFGLKEPKQLLDMGNSGTTLRLLMGILAAQPFHSTLIGDASLSRRPMGRVAQPLRMMGADIRGTIEVGREIGKAEYLPLTIRGKKLNGIHYHLPIPSAQVKSALLLAGLYAQSETIITEPIQTRNHTELMLRSFGIDLKMVGERIILFPQQKLLSTELYIPGDFSSAAFFIAAALLVPGSELILRNVGLNPTRTGFITAIQQMGGEIEIVKEVQWGAETVVDLRVKYQPLQGVIIKGDLIPLLIDELPILAVLATQAEGVTEIRNAEELRVKESDRIIGIVSQLQRMKAVIEELPDGMRIVGKTDLWGARVNSFSDHRLAMSLIIAGLIADGETVVEGSESISISYPRFVQDLKEVSST